MDKIYVVLTVTDEGSDVAGAYRSRDAAMHHIEMRYKTELQNYIEEFGDNFDDLFQDYISPLNEKNGSAYLGTGDNDFWSWRIEEVGLR